MIIHFAIDDLRYIEHSGTYYDETNVGQLIDDLMSKYDCIWVFHNRALSSARSGMFYDYNIASVILYYDNNMMNLIVIQNKQYDYDTEEHIDRSKRDDEIPFLTTDEHLAYEFGLTNYAINEYCKCRRAILEAAKKYKYNAESGTTETRYNTLAIYHDEKTKNELIYKLFMKYGLCQFVNKVFISNRDIICDLCVANIVNGRINVQRRKYSNNEIAIWFDNVGFESPEDFKTTKAKLESDIETNQEIEYEVYDALTNGVGYNPTRDRKITK